MTYRGPNQQRMAQQQAATILQHAGQTATWRKYVSASTGNPLVGLGSALYYSERIITAQLFGQPGQGFNLPDGQRMVGQLTEGEFVMACREEMGTQDELRWRGDTYRIESDRVPTRIGGNFMYIIKRGQ